MATNDRQLWRWAARGAILSGIVEIGAIVLTLIAANGSSNTAPTAAFALTHYSPTPLHWSYVLDMVSYPLLLPLILFLWTWLRGQDRNAVDLYSISALIYVIVGSIGAAILAIVLPDLIRSYAAGPHAVLVVTYRTVENSVQSGMWELLEGIVAGVWYVGMGLMLRRTWTILGWVTVLEGALALIDALGQILNVAALTTAGIGIIWVMLFPIWALWIGIALLRTPVEVSAPAVVPPSGAYANR